VLDALEWRESFRRGGRRPESERQNWVMPSSGYSFMTPLRGDWEPPRERGRWDEGAESEERMEDMVDGRPRCGDGLREDEESGIPVEGRSGRGMPVEGRDCGGMPVEGRSCCGTPVKGRGPSSWRGIPVPGRGDLSILWAMPVIGLSS
jgi:hypothetical protein